MWKVLMLSLLILLSGCTRKPNESIEKIWRLIQPLGTYQVGLNPTSIAAADFNEDGSTDLLITNISGNSLSLLIGNGDGTFQDTTTLQKGDMPRVIVAHDFNGDGHEDFVLGSAGDEKLSVFLGNGDGTFRNGQVFDTERPTLAIALSDLDGNGKVDMAVSFKSDKVEIFLSKGDGTFTEAEVLELQDTPTSIAIADYNADDILDMAVANNGAMSNNVSVFLGQGGGHFTPPGHFPTGMRPLFVSHGDFNGDKRLDLLVINGTKNALSFMAGNGDGTFQKAKNFGAGVNPAACINLDVNKDGYLDTLVVNTTSGTMSLVLGQGDGTFRHPPIEYKTEFGPFTIQAVEFTPGGQKGIIVANNSKNSISVFSLRTPSSPIPVT